MVGVTFLFLQDWRATLIPTLTIPVSLVGCFAVLLTLGFSANTLTLFALILAIGLVVDDAIVVVENVQRVMEEEGLAPKEAAVKAMGQVTSPIISTTLVMLAVFVPVGFIPGITGKLYQQFAVTISTSVVLSAINALTLSPALCATLLKPHQPIKRGPLAWFSRLLGKSSRTGICGHGHHGWPKRNGSRVGSLSADLRRGLVVCSTTGPQADPQTRTRGSFSSTPNCPRLPPWPAPRRDDATGFQASQGDPGGAIGVIAVSGFSLLSGSSENVGLAFAILEDWSERKPPNANWTEFCPESVPQLAARPSRPTFLPFGRPAIQGLGNTSGFNFQLQAFTDQTIRRNCRP